MAPPTTTITEHEDDDREHSAMMSPSEQSSAIVLVDQPTDVLLDEFKSQVRTWMELDNIIKNLQTALRDRRLYKKHLTTKIVDFMNRYNIEDLDTREGSLRSRVTYAKSPLSQKAIRDGIANYFANNTAIGTQVTDAIFNSNRERIERVSLRRVPSRR